MIFHWRMPTRNELIEEFKTEFDIQELYDATQYRKEHNDRRMETFVKHMNNDGGIYFNLKSIPWYQIVELKDDWSYYHAESMSELEGITHHMGKKPREILNGLVSPMGVPFVLMVRRFDNSLKVLGGRTRASICVLHKQNIQAMVIEEAEVSRDLLKQLRQEWLLKYPKDGEERWRFMEAIVQRLSLYRGQRRSPSNYIAVRELIRMNYPETKDVQHLIDETNMATMVYKIQRFNDPKDL